MNTKSTNWFSRSVYFFSGIAVFVFFTGAYIVFAEEPIDSGIDLGGGWTDAGSWGDTWGDVGNWGADTGWDNAGSWGTDWSGVGTDTSSWNTTSNDWVDEWGNSNPWGDSNWINTDTGNEQWSDTSAWASEEWSNNGLGSDDNWSDTTAFNDEVWGSTSNAGDEWASADASSEQWDDVGSLNHDIWTPAPSEDAWVDTSTENDNAWTDATYENDWENTTPWNENTWTTASSELGWVNTTALNEGVWTSTTYENNWVNTSNSNEGNWQNTGSLDDGNWVKIADAIDDSGNWIKVGETEDGKWVKVGETEDGKWVKVGELSQNEFRGLSNLPDAQSERSNWFRNSQGALAQGARGYGSTFGGMGGGGSMGGSTRSGSMGGMSGGSMGGGSMGGGSMGGMGSSMSMPRMQTMAYAMPMSYQYPMPTYNPSMPTPLPQPSYQCSLSFNKSQIAHGESVTLSWSSNVPTSAKGSITGIGSVASQGSRSFNNFALGSHTLTLAFANNVRCQATITVSNTVVPPTPVPPTPVPPQTPAECTILASKQSIYAGESVILSWASNTGSWGTLSGFGQVPSVGTRTVAPRSAATYTFTNSTGARCSVSVSVMNPVGPQRSAPTCSIIARQSGNGYVLQWTTWNASSASINGGIGPVSVPEGSRWVNGAGPFTLTVQGNGGVSYCQTQTQQYLAASPVQYVGAAYTAAAATPVTYVAQNSPTPVAPVVKVMNVPRVTEVVMEEIPYTGFEDQIMPLFMLALAISGGYMSTKVLAVR